MAKFGNIEKISAYNQFVDNMMARLEGYIVNDDTDSIKINNLSPEDYVKNGEAKIKICPEPISFYKDRIEGRDDSKKVFNELLDGFETIEVKKPSNSMWINKTIDGINLRLGNYKDDDGRQDPIVLKDSNVHGVIVGRTGSGKSVLLNNILLNLVTEYAPWELDLYLVDMKKVELSRYMAIDEKTKRYLTPHVVALGATNEVRYVVSMIDKIEECMQCRQNLFQKLGFNKIKDFCEHYRIVLPRILLLVDEFQQLFSENYSTPRERNILSNKISSITKLGRATGVHMILASQEMGGALSEKDLMNFKLRIALQCDSAVSSKILGNDEAAKIDLGITLVNQKGGSTSYDDNIHYKTPMIDDKKKDDGSDSDFEIYLRKVFDESLKLPWKKPSQKFYEEGVLPNKERLKNLIENKIVSNQVDSIKKAKMSIIQPIILGTPVLFNLKKNDFEYVFIEIGRKRNIAIISQNDNLIGNMLKILVNNFNYSNNKYIHNVIYESEIIKSIYPDMVEDLLLSSKNSKEISLSQCNLSAKKTLFELLSTQDYANGYESFLKRFIYKYINNFDDETYKNLVSNFGLQFVFSKPTLLKYLKDALSKVNITENSYKESMMALMNKIIEKHKELDAKLGNNIEGIGYDEFGYFTIIITMLQQINPNSSKFIYKENIDTLSFIDKSIELKKYSNDVYIINWMLGTDNVDKDVDKLLNKRMEECTRFNEFYILVGNEIENLESCYRNCNYVFINSNDEKVYTKLKTEFSIRVEGNKSIDCKIINYNKQFTFNPFDFETNRFVAPKIDFDEVNFNDL